MEKYLIDQYDILEDENWLTSVDVIEDFFKDGGYEYFDCGQGYYQDEAEVICKIGDKFYKVALSAEIESAKQDRGDRLYWVESISKVEYEEIEKPKPIPEESIRYTVEVTDSQRKQLDRFLNENQIKFEKEASE